tara:strand:+ start:408 stop:1289 length:882 start_codon:yes stop_codon:yes gene_type:complete
MVDYGKHHLREYARANKKTFTKWEQFSATRFSFTDVTTREVFTNENVNVYSYKTTGYKDVHSYTDCYINHKEYVHDSNRADNKTIFVDIQKCLPTDILFPLYANNGVVNKISTYGGEQLDNNIEYIKSCRNIVPFKTNLVSKAALLLNKFCQFNKRNPYGHDVIKAYKNDKQMVYQYLDDYIFNCSYYVEHWLRNNNIEYEYFNLDEDSYKECFGWDNTKLEWDPKWKNVEPVPPDSWFKNRDVWDIDEVGDMRQVTGPIPFFKTDKDWEQYHELEQISKKYISYTNKTHTKL